MNVRLPTGLFKRGKGYAVRVAVPAEYQPIIGKKEIVRGLESQDLSEALSKRKATLAEILNAIGEGTTPDPRQVKTKSLSPLEGITIRDTVHR